ncbi:MAG: menaquinone biosynthesis protein [Candidatus Korobacteraceae bacterium]|jgi:chorismate dehydratase
MAPLRISAISFLNTAPLMWDFEHGEAGRDFAIEYTIPSACAAALAANQADIGIIPAFTYAEIPGLVILPNIAIATRDFVRSILLVSRKPMEQVETVATDTSSRTSVALLQVLFAKFFGGPRQLTPHAPQLDHMLHSHDAALLIGDAALEIAVGKEYFVYDLAHLWHERTGQPFVFAFWAVRLDSLDRAPRDLDLVKVFQQSRDHGLEPANLRVIAQQWSSKLRLSEADILTYLTENVHYYLDRQNHAGLQLFLRYAQEIGLVPAAPELRFLGPVAFGSSRK